MGADARKRLGEYYSTHLPVKSAIVEGLPGTDIMAWGGDAALTRAYRPRHPNIRFLPLRFPGRGVELGTEKQYYLWRYISDAVDRLPPRKSWRVTLQQLADRVGLSRSQISRFLKKLDWWRAIDVCAIPGRGGCVYIWASPKPSQDGDAEFKQYISPHLLQRARFKILRHRVWQSRFDAWRQRYEEVREIAKEWFRVVSATPITTLARNDVPGGAY
jgi:hypothetical protein